MKAKVVYDQHGNTLGMTTAKAEVLTKEDKNRKISPDIVFDEIEVRVNQFATGPSVEVDYIRFEKKGRLSRKVEKAIARTSINVPVSVDVLR